MTTIYTDGNGTYYQPGDVNAQDGTKTDVNVRSQALYTTQAMMTATIPGAWTVAPNLSDIGGGVWWNGHLVDPQFAQ